MYDFLAAQSIEKAHLIVQKNYCSCKNSRESLQQPFIGSVLRNQGVHSAEDIIKMLLKLTETLPREYLKFFFLSIEPQKNTLIS